MRFGFAELEKKDSDPFHAVTKCCVSLSTISQCAIQNGSHQHYSPQAKIALEQPKKKSIQRRECCLEESIVIKIWTCALTTSKNAATLCKHKHITDIGIAIIVIPELPTRAYASLLPSRPDRSSCLIERQPRKPCARTVPAATSGKAQAVT